MISGFRRHVEEIFTLRGCVMVNFYWRFGARYLSLLQGSRNTKLKLFLISCPLKMGPISCLETSIRIYHSPLLNNPEELKSHLLRKLIWTKTPRIFVILCDMTNFVSLTAGEISVLICWRVLSGIHYWHAQLRSFLVAFLLGRERNIGLEMTNLCVCVCVCARERVCSHFKVWTGWPSFTKRALSITPL